ncbi:MAG TPA: hypothetical protein VGU72_17605 [Beijerinckiaceae bacterium]|jgi:hypothetical protein|nr:hypothetical protein [Beijerinckiaceae bacterium]
MKTFFPALLLTLVGASVAQAQTPCLISKEKAAQLRPGATLDSIQRTLGCKLMSQSSTGFGETAQDIYGVQDDTGNRLFVLLGKNGKLVRTNYQPRQLNPPDPLAPRQPPQQQQQQRTR